ncbi:hypothetical protein Q1W71_02360 [Flavobacterium pectinovorum]|uniref:hypothetical protein n=1 Tax=Flavobacterium pectinovorum TaxID=29533 RepID=UPI00265EAAFC|nr:hypothetical protein [Flavobacterium pectinovorum]WKL48631.1 hypothetical protein Q1W71_02360 [Flavobacterium pectinovorum]
MVEKNYDPDNDNCPEKDTVENLLKSKIDSDKNTKMAKEFTHDNPNRILKEKNDLKHIENSDDTKR